MNKRQRKKNQRKYLPVIADEFPLLGMTHSELDEASNAFNRYRQRYAFKYHYKDLKQGGYLRYHYKRTTTHMIESILNVGLGKPSVVTVVQDNDSLSQ